jgi:hypothetical protein
MKIVAGTRLLRVVVLLAGMTASGCDSDPTGVQESTRDASTAGEGSEPDGSAPDSEPGSQPDGERRSDSNDSTGIQESTRDAPTAGEGSEPDGGRPADASDGGGRGDTQTCPSSDGTCSSEGASRCNGEGVQSCIREGDCLLWSKVYACDYKGCSEGKCNIFCPDGTRDSLVACDKQCGLRGMQCCRPMECYDGSTCHQPPSSTVPFCIR